MESKDVKQRLEELQDLLKSGYITESEFQTARANALREGGVDITPTPTLPRFRRRIEEEDEELTLEERRLLEKEEAERRGCGCGCFLFLLLVLAAAVLGFAFAFPESWPSQYGGDTVRALRLQIVEKIQSYTNDPEPVPVQPSAPVSSARPVLDPIPAVGSESPSNLPQSAEPNVPATPPVETISTEPEAPQAIQPPPETPPARAASLPAETPATPDAIDFPVLPDPASPEEPPHVTIIEVSSPASEATVSALGTEEITTGGVPIPQQPLYRGHVSARSARIRSAPDTSDKDNVVGWGRSGDRFVVLQEGKGADGSAWYLVRYEDGKKQGWISGSLLEIER